MWHAESLAQEAAMDEQIILEEELIAEERAIEAARLGAAMTRRRIGKLPGLRAPLCVAPDISVADAVALMTEHRIGCILVVDAGRLTGVFTERDVLTKVVAGGLDAAATRVAQVMTAEPECLTLDDRVAYALNMMSVGGFRHIPLVDSEGRPTGVLAMRDVVDFIVDLFPAEVLNLPPSPAHAIAREREGA
ncbi:MAG: CBS domain-containing protein [Candidatus Binatia bacterium]